MGNLEFALTLHLAAMTGFSTKLLIPNQLAASERANDEVITAIRWLLQQNPGEINLSLSQSHHYLWTFLKNTILRPTFLAWESDVEDAVDSVTFKEEYVRKVSTILS